MSLQVLNDVLKGPTTNTALIAPTLHGRHLQLTYGDLARCVAHCQRRLLQLPLAGILGNTSNGTTQPPSTTTTADQPPTPAPATAGTTIALAVPNSVEGIVVYLAVTGLGWTVAPLNPALSVSEMEFFLQDGGCQAVVCLGCVQSRGTGVMSASPSMDRSSGNSGGVNAKVSALGAVEAASQLGLPVWYCQWTDDGIQLHCSSTTTSHCGNPLPLTVDTVAMILHTSGTTSRPKCAVSCFYQFYNCHLSSFLCLQLYA